MEVGIVLVISVPKPNVFIAGVLVNNVTITVPNWTASNGAYHRISEVLFRDQL